MDQKARNRDLFVVDNSVSGWTALHYLEEWTEIGQGCRPYEGFNFPDTPDAVAPSEGAESEPAPPTKKLALKRARAKRGRPHVKRGRPSAFADDAKIKVVTKENPHRKGSICYKYFAKYKDGMTVVQALKAGIPRANLRYLERLGHIKIPRKIG